MKAAYFFSLALGLTGYVAHAQSQPQKGDNIILVQTQDSATVALKKLGQLFVAQGFTVERYEPQLNSLVLSPKTLPSTLSPTLLARATASSGPNSTLRLFGEYQVRVLGKPVNDIVEIKGSEKGVPISGYRALQKVAIAYPGGTVSYGKQ